MKFLLLMISVQAMIFASMAYAETEELPPCSCGLHLDQGEFLGNKTSAQYTMRVLPDESGCYRMYCDYHVLGKGFVQAVDAEISNGNVELVLGGKPRRYAKGPLYEYFKKNMDNSLPQQTCKPTLDSKNEVYFVSAPVIQTLTSNQTGVFSRTCNKLIRATQSTNIAP